MRLIIMKGFPGSGKSTRVKEMMSNDPGLVRIEPDLVRRMLHGRQYDENFEIAVEQVVLASVKTLLLSPPPNVTAVVVDECNMNPLAVENWQALAMDVEFELVDLSNVTKEECIRRDSLRPDGKRVGADVIDKISKISNYINLPNL